MLLLAACSAAPQATGGTSGGPGASGAVESVGASTGPGPAGSGAAVTLDPGLVIGSGPFIASDTTAGLEELTSYTATLTKSFEGTVDGAAQSWEVTITLTVGAAGSHLIVETTGAGAIELPGEVYALGDLVYQVADGGACTAAVAEAPDALRTAAEPASMLYAVVGGDPAGDETVNGVASTKVTFDERAIGMDGVVSATGALWSADTGGYLARYSLTADGGPTFFGESVTGRQTWHYDVTDVNQPVSIQPPAGCPAGKVGADVMPGATDVVDAPGVLLYSVAASIEDVIAFYQSKEAEEGWTEVEAPLFKDGVGVLELTSAAGKITVLVTAGEAGRVDVHVALDSGK